MSRTNSYTCDLCGAKNIEPRTYEIEIPSSEKRLTIMAMISNRPLGVFSFFNDEEAHLCPVCMDDALANIVNSSKTEEK
jgi:hypothetical protein